MIPEVPVECIIEKSIEVLEVFEMESLKMEIEGDRKKGVMQAQTDIARLHPAVSGMIPHRLNVPWASPEAHYLTHQALLPKCVRFMKVSKLLCYWPCISHYFVL